MYGGASDARDLARRLLSDVMPTRWAHTQAVAEKAMSLRHVLDERAPIVQAAAWLHDVGYSPSLVDTGFHPLDGARHLRDHTNISPAVLVLVAHHTGAAVEAEHRGLLSELLKEFPLTAEDELALAALTYSDMTVGPAGQPMSVDERLAEILERYPAGDVVHRSIRESSSSIRLQCAEIEELLRQQ